MVIQRIWEHCRSGQNKSHPDTSNNYVLKVRGSREYIYGSSRMFDFEAVYEVFHLSSSCLCV